MSKRQNPIRRLLSDAVSRLPPINKRQFLMRAIPFIILFYIGDKFAWLYQYCQGQTALVRLFNLLANCQMAFQPPWFSFAAEHMLAGLILSGAVLLIMIHRSRNAKKYRFGMEYGSARWSA